MRRLKKTKRFHLPWSGSILNVIGLTVFRQNTEQGKFTARFTGNTNLMKFYDVLK